MNKLKIINFFNPTLNMEAYNLLTQACCSGFRYPQTAELLSKKGFYIPEDQFTAFNKVLNVQMNLDIGSRQFEVANNE